MAYVEHYYGQFEDITGKITYIAIDEDGYSGSSERLVLDGDNPIVISSNTHGRVRSMVVTVRIRNTFTDRFLFAKMLQQPYTTYRCRITYNGSQVFIGYMLPITYSQYLEYVDLSVLRFSSGLGNLQNFYPTFLTDTGEDWRTQMEILSGILDLLAYDYKIYINTTLYEDYLSSSEMGDNPLKSLYNNRLLFQQNDTNWDTALTIFNKLLTGYNMWAHSENNIIYIQRFVDMKTASKTWWTYDSLLSNPYGSVPEAFTVIDLDTLQLRNESIRYSADPPIKLYKLYLRPVQYSNLVKNNFKDLLYDVGSGVEKMYRWNYNSYIVVENDSYSSGFISSGVILTKESTAAWADFANARFTWKGQFTNSNDTVKLKLSWKDGGYIDANSAVDYQYQIILYKFPGGTHYYVTQSGTLTSSSPANRTITVENNGSAGISQSTFSDTIDLTGLLNSLGLDGDIYVNFVIWAPLYYTIGSTSKTPTKYTIGDINLSLAEDRNANYIEADLNNSAFKEVEETLDIFDTSKIHIYNTIARAAATGYYWHAESWSDDLWSGKSLQQHYILDMAQLYQSAVPKFSILVTDRTKEITMRDMFSTSKLKDDSDNDMIFWITSYEWNIKQHTYKLEISKWLNWVGLGL